MHYVIVIITYCVMILYHTIEEEEFTVSKGAGVSCVVWLADVKGILAEFIGGRGRQSCRLTRQAPLAGEMDWASAARDWRSCKLRHGMRGMICTYTENFGPYKV